MKIAIDLRSLSSGNVSGVENYTMNLAENLLSLDRQNQYSLFYNSFEQKPPEDFRHVNSRLLYTRIPNKILNLCLKMNYWNIEKFTGPADWFFMPNLNQFSILPQTKLAITVHDLSPVVAPEFYDLKRRLWHWFLNYQKAFDRANLIFAVSEYTKTDLVRLFKVEPKKIRVVYPGIDHKIYQPGISEEKLRETRNLLGLPGDYLLFLNTIEPRKNLENLIRAFELIKHPAHLVIAGKDGWKNKKIFKRIRRSKKAGKIRYLGYVPESRKPFLIKMSRALVYPSFYEGFGFQPLEAMGLNVPVIASQVTAIPEVAGDSALLINPYNVADLTFAMEEILANRRLKDALVKKGAEHGKKFNWEKTAGLILKALNENRD